MNNYFADFLAIMIAMFAKKTRNEKRWAGARL